MNISPEIIVEAREVSFSYKRGGMRHAVLDRFTMAVRKGEFLALAGGTGSGKTTLAMLLSGLLFPDSGEVLVNGIDTRDRERIWEIRSAVGMVFQQPDNQIVGTTVEEDVAFGPENLGLPPEMVRERVRSAIEAVGMADCGKKATSFLSGGEKQKLALAGVMAMNPDLIILDEATSMLDTVSRERVMDILRGLNREAGKTVLLITNRMEEAALADRIVVVDSGRVVLEGPPAEIFSSRARIEKVGLELPPLAELFHLLSGDGFNLPAGINDMDEAVLTLMDACNRGAHHVH